MWHKLFGSLCCWLHLSIFIWYRLIRFRSYRWAIVKLGGALASVLIGSCSIYESLKVLSNDGPTMHGHDTDCFSLRRINLVNLRCAHTHTEMYTHWMVSVQRMCLMMKSLTWELAVRWQQAIVWKYLGWKSLLLHWNRTKHSWINGCIQLVRQTWVRTSNVLISHSTRD